MNSVNLIGRLTHEVENRRTSTGRVVAKFTLAVNSYSKDEEGNKKAYFFDCEAWDDLGKRLWNDLRKGDQISITGYLVQYTFERKDTSKGSAVKIVVNSVDYLSPKHEDAKEKTDPLDKQYEEAIAKDDEQEVKDDDLPF